MCLSVQHGDIVCKGTFACKYLSVSLSICPSIHSSNHSFTHPYVSIIGSWGRCPGSRSYWRRSKRGSCSPFQLTQTSWDVFPWVQSACKGHNLAWVCRGRCLTQKGGCILFLTLNHTRPVGRDKVGTEGPCILLRRQIGADPTSIHVGRSPSGPKSLESRLVCIFKSDFLYVSP